MKLLAMVLVALSLLILTLSACGESENSVGRAPTTAADSVGSSENETLVSQGPVSASGSFADVIELTYAGSPGEYTFSVTVRSPDTDAALMRIGGRYSPWMGSCSTGESYYTAMSMNNPSLVPVAPFASARRTRSSCSHT